MPCSAVRLRQRRHLERSEGLHNRHVFDAPNFELRQAGSNIAIPFLNETSGSAIIARNMRMEACSPLASLTTSGRCRR